MMARGGSRSLDEPEKHSPGIFYPGTALRGRAPPSPCGLQLRSLALLTREDGAASPSPRLQLPAGQRSLAERAGSSLPLT